MKFSKKCYPDEIWVITQNYAGITKVFFNEYFKGRTIAYAIEIKNLRIYDEPVALTFEISAGEETQKRHWQILAIAPLEVIYAVQSGSTAAMAVGRPFFASE